MREPVQWLVDALGSRDPNEVLRAIPLAHQLMEKSLTERVTASLGSDDEWWERQRQSVRRVRCQLPSIAEIRRRFADTLPSELLDVVLDEEEGTAVSDALERLFERRDVAESAISAFAQTGRLSIVPHLADLLRHTLESDRRIALAVVHVLPMIFDGLDPRIEMTTDEYQALASARDAMRLARDKWADEDYLGLIASAKLRYVEDVLIEFGKRSRRRTTGRRK